MSSRKVSFAPLALADLDEVLQYTLQVWGSDQLIAYGDLLIAGVQRIAQFPGLGTQCEQLGPGLHFKLVELHEIYYMYDDVSLTVARILHERMDPGRLIW
jgi:toxin ParE1/3/4